MTSLPIPTTLDEVVDQIIAGMTDQQKADYAREPEARAGAGYHHGFGTGLRNELGLWHGRTRISKWFRARRIVHADDASGTIFKALWRKLHDLPIDDEWVAKEAAFYERFWAKSGLTWDQKPIPGFKPKTSRLLRVEKDGKVTEVDE